MDASLKCKIKFDKEINDFANLKPVKVRKWVGIGAVRYVPDYLIDKFNEINKYMSEIKNKNSNTNENDSDLVNEETKNGIESESETHDEMSREKIPRIIEDEKLNSEIEKYIKEINELNEQLVKNLQAQDGAFSIGIATDGLKAVKFGMTADPDSIKSLATQVQDLGKELDESSRVFKHFF